MKFPFTGITALVFMLLMPFFASSQHYWLSPEPAIAEKKQPVRLSILYGDKLQPQAGAEVPVIEKFNLYTSRDSFSLQEQATGTNALVAGDFVKDPFFAGATLHLPEKNLVLSNISHQLTKEQKAILAQTDTSALRNGAQARQIRYVKALVSLKSGNDKAELYKRQLNHPLEILLTTDPSKVKPGSQVYVQVLLHQRVLPNFSFTVWRQEKNGKTEVSEVKTNKYGLRMITIAKPGNYVVVATQEGPHKIGLSDDVHWKSLEASYFFTIE